MKCYAVIGEDMEGLPFVGIATSTFILKLSMEEARDLAAKLTRVADSYGRYFKDEPVGYWGLTNPSPSAPPPIPRK